MAEIRISDLLKRKSQDRMYGNQHCSFYYDIVPNEELSRKEGRHVCDEVLMIEITNFGGERTPVRANPIHLKEYKDEYEAFLALEEKPVTGQPICEWPMISRTAMIELRLHGFKTLEQLAEATEDQKLFLGSLSVWCKRAEEFIKAAKTPRAEVVRLREELEAVKAKNEKLLDQVDTLLVEVQDYHGNRLTNGRHVDP